MLNEQENRVNKTYVNQHTNIVPEFRRGNSLLLEKLNRSGFIVEALVNMALLSRSIFVDKREERSVVFCLVNSRSTDTHKESSSQGINEIQLL